MKVAGLTATGDWQFGRGKATYKSGSDAISQNLMTRIKSVAGDWFLNLDEHIDWDTILGRKNNEAQIKSELIRVALSTYGVASVTGIELTSLDGRDAIFTIGYIDIFETNNELEVSV